MLHSGWGDWWRLARVRTGVHPEQCLFFKWSSLWSREGLVRPAMPKRSPFTSDPAAMRSWHCKTWRWWVRFDPSDGLGESLKWLQGLRSWELQQKDVGWICGGGYERGRDQCKIACQTTNATVPQDSTDGKRGRWREVPSFLQLQELEFQERLIVTVNRTSLGYPTGIVLQPLLVVPQYIYIKFLS